VAAAILVAACGGAPGAVDETTTTSLPATTTTAASTTTAATGSEPVVVALQSGRGDDGSFEIDAWITGLSPASGSTIVVGIDADDSYAGIGDPTADLEGYLEVSYGAESTDQRVVVDGDVVASSDQGTVSEWVSWGYSAGYLRVYFIGDVAPLSGTVWVVTSSASGSVRGSAAGTDVGYACSARGSALAVEVASDVPDPGVVCLYP